MVYDCLSHFEIWQLIAQPLPIMVVELYHLYRICIILYQMGMDKWLNFWGVWQIYAGKLYQGG